MKKYYLFGAGSYGRIAFDTLKNDIEIIGYLDNNKDLHGDGVLFPDEADKDVPVIIATGQQHWSKIEKQLDSLNIKHITYDKFVFDSNKEKISDICDLLYDDFSKKTLKEIVFARSENDYSRLNEIYCENQYFAIPGFVSNYGKSETFVDAGAYVGDTVEKYLFSYEGIFRKIYAFEPSDKQYAALKIRISRLCAEWALSEERIIPVNAALSDSTGFCNVMHGGNNLGSDYIVKVNDPNGGDILTKQYALDDFLSGEEVDFIKADIEGAEMQMLIGAQNTIKKWHPKLAICLYHNPIDFIEIPIFIKKLCPNYNLQIRHHTHEYNETVLYAWCEK